jgi:type II secretory ATPase GspE/PulE/Tfp pilus assembly ATPase PilB-like protein
MSQAVSQASAIKLVPRLSDAEKLKNANPLIQLYASILFESVKRGASDIHFEPMERAVIVRIRVDGELCVLRRIERPFYSSFLNQVKRLANLDVAVRGKPQDGRISYDHLKHDARVSLIPTLYGEKIVMRLLELEKAFSLERSGLSPEAVQDLKLASQKKSGLILISGPTGSGKTTTLFSLLASLNSESQNIMTIEDPIEYRLPGLTQVQVSSRIGFSDALRSAMRQDPDVILVGEVRDEETARLAIQAANTGHLVLSTVHANSSAAVIERLANLGVDPYSLKSSLLLTSAQRLLRRLCQACATEFPDGTKERNPAGCPNCRSGVVGRFAVIEYASEMGIKSHFDGNGLLLSGGSLKEKALALARAGEVERDEAYSLS